ncbi:pq-loop repeat-containing protein 2 [Diaporthe amygdali]|uniref:pq-loop repeat-containing protein 2 n=1 Tax=Phomopsis amygdali TaxID=1214568 RepID=UPI0022FE4729|nr:pq-loop repeat-containing protein 2 [Diaporthe amygdali]KAJ0116335.1 pq-loop repeat-containing protein 2 [Diaporthe amygdali]
MAPPTQPLNLDVEAISGIAGSISIACWVVVFSPQIIENFRRSAADGLSLQFVIVWLAGDVFNILGAVLQGVLPTMIILAIYYTIADIVLLGQCFYYRGFTWKDEVVPPTPKKKNNNRVNGENGGQHRNGNGNGASNNGGGPEPNERTSLLDQRERRGSDWSERLIHVNPIVPINEPSATPPPPASTLQAVAWNTVAVIMVIGAGVAGWALSHGYGSDEHGDEPSGGDAIHFDLWGQIFGYLCAVLYLGSRLPQLLLNWRRKSTEGLSMLFFLFACLGNLTYALSIFAFDPKCYGDDAGCEPGEAGRIYGRYILVNLSWLAGSVGTLLLDMGVFVQFFLYNKTSDDDEEDMDGSAIEDDEDGRSIDGDRWDQRPILERNQSEWST